MLLSNWRLFCSLQIMIRYLVLFVALFQLVACDNLAQDTDTAQNKRARTYSYSCIDSGVAAKPMSRKLEKAGDLIRNLGVSRKSITDSVQTAYGLMFHQQMLQEGEFKLVNDAALKTKLTKVMNDLLSVREDPSHIQYAIYALKDTMINAFTFGGRIYVTSGMLEKCKGKDDLLYAIIGHEIGHSEMGHIKSTIQEMELSTKVFGEQTGATVFELKKFLTASFNQKNELEADYYGINLTNELGYDVCTAVSFWKEMASHENRYNELEDFFRTHPFSSLRAECLMNHIRTNFGKDCGLDKKQLLPQVVK